MLERKVLIILLGYILGIIMELYFEKGIALIVLVLLLSFLGIKYVRFSRKSILSPKSFEITKRIVKHFKILLNAKIICIFIISFIGGIIYTKNLNCRYNNLYLGLEDGYFLGIIQSDPEEREYTTKYKIKIQNVNQNEKYKNTYLYLTVKNDVEKLEYGDLVFFKGEYIEPDGQKNYGGFNYKEYLKTLKIYGTVRCTSSEVNVYEKNKINIISLKMNDLAKIIKENAYRLFEEKEANLLIGILIGDTKGLDEEIENNFRDSSLIHILAVSGSHINYIILSLVYINNKTNLSKKVGRVLTIILLILFMFLVGFSASVVRAVIMGIIIMFSKLFYRKLDIVNSISFSALILLIINPFNIINVGFLLSFGGTIGIAALSQNLSELFIKENKKGDLILIEKQYVNKFIKFVKEILTITISAQIIIMPIILRLFNTISLTFFISNLLASPIMGVVTVYGFITIFISFIAISISKVLAIPLEFLIKFLIFIADFFGSMKISKIYVVTIPMIFIVIYYICVYIINYYICSGRS